MDKSNAANQHGIGKSTHKHMRTVATASFAGALMEWYDFFLFGTASALVFNKLFFPSFSPEAGTIASFATFGVGFIARPLGGVIFGHFGDRFGRKSVLVTTLMIMGIGTVLIGCLPTYEQVGIMAPILMVVLRLAQGLGLGGEYAGAALMTIEHAPQHRRGFWGSLPQAASSGGILLSTGAFALVSSLDEPALLSWGWRVPFLVSALLLAVGMVIRLKVRESPEFERARAKREQRNTTPIMPLVEVFRQHRRAVMLAFGARLGETVTSNLINAFGIYYVSTYTGLNKSNALNGMLIASAFGLVAVPVFGALSDKLGRGRVYLGGAIFGVLLAYPLFLLFDTGSIMLVTIGFTVAYVLVPTTMFSVQSTFFAGLFGAGVRFTGLSLAYQVSAIVGGYVPTVATALLAASGGSPLLVILGFAGTSTLTAICVLLAGANAKYTRREDDTFVQRTSRPPDAADPVTPGTG